MCESSQAAIVEVPQQTAVVPPTTKQNSILKQDPTMKQAPAAEYTPTAKHIPAAEEKTTSAAAEREYVSPKKEQKTAKQTSPQSVADFDMVFDEGVKMAEYNKKQHIEIPDHELEELERSLKLEMKFGKKRDSNPESDHFVDKLHEEEDDHVVHMRREKKEAANLLLLKECKGKETVENDDKEPLAPSTQTAAEPRFLLDQTKKALERVAQAKTARMEIVAAKTLEEKQHLLEAALRKFKKISMLHHDSKFKAVRDAEVERWFHEDVNSAPFSIAGLVPRRLPEGERFDRMIEAGTSEFGEYETRLNPEPRLNDRVFPLRTFEIKSEMAMIEVAVQPQSLRKEINEDETCLDHIITGEAAWDCADPMGTLFEAKEDGDEKIVEAKFRETLRPIDPSERPMEHAIEGEAAWDCLDAMGTLSDEEIAIFEGFSATLRLLNPELDDLDHSLPSTAWETLPVDVIRGDILLREQEALLAARKARGTLTEKQRSARIHRMNARFKSTLSSDLTAPFFQEVVKVLLPEDVPAICRRHAEAHQAVIDARAVRGSKLTHFLFFSASAGSQHESKAWEPQPPSEEGALGATGFVFRSAKAKEAMDARMT